MVVPYFARRGSIAPSGTSFSPPAFFKPANDPYNVRLVPYAGKGSRMTAAQKTGVRYEKAFGEFMKSQWPEDYLTFENQMFTFMTARGPRWCRPDGVLRLGARLTVFEVKYRHTAESWWQLHKLYSPVLESFWKVAPICVEVCKFFDIDVFYPGPIERRSSGVLLGLGPVLASLSPAETLVIDGWQG